ncbi:MAG: ribosome-associated translation inhibitor RaiA [Bacilli bacterium]
MKYNIHGKKMEVTDSIKNYIETKIGKLNKYFDQPDEITATVVVRVRGFDKVVEVTIVTKNVILRGEVCNKDLYAAIDLVSEKIEGQIRKNKTRMHKRTVKSNFGEFNLDFEINNNEREEKIMRRKKIEMKPMSEEEAILQMNLLDHSFFVFKNSVNNSIDIVYKRNDGNYGIIETE